MDESAVPGTRAALAARRDERLQRARRISRWSAGGAVLLAGLFAGLAAQARPGHHLRPASATPAAVAPAQQPDQQAPEVSPPAAPDQPPAVTQAPPVAQSGGS